MRNLGDCGYPAKPDTLLGMIFFQLAVSKTVTDGRQVRLLNNRRSLGKMVTISADSLGKAFIIRNLP